MRIFIPAGALAVLLAAYTWFWFDAKGRIEREILEWQTEQRERGLIATWEEMRVSGYPFRLQVRLKRPRLEETATDLQWFWQGRHLTAWVLPYDFRHVIIDGGGDHTSIIRRVTDEGTFVREIEGTAESARASLVWRRKDIDRLAIDLTGLKGRMDAYRLESGTEKRAAEAQDMTVERFQLHSVKAEAPEELERAAFAEDSAEDTADGDAPEEPVYGKSEGGSRRLSVRAQNVRWLGHTLPGFGDHLKSGEIRLTLTGLPEEDIRRHGATDEVTLRAWRANRGRLFLDHAALDWPPVEMRARGRVKIDGKGRPRGRLEVTTSKPVGFVDVLEGADIVRGTAADLVRAAVGFMAQAMGRDGEVSIPVKVKKGRVSVANVKVGKTGRVLKKD